MKMQETKVAGEEEEVGGDVGETDEKTEEV